MKSVSQSKKTTQIPKVDDVNFIQKSNGFIKGYSVNTFHGMAKNYNQDRVSIIMNITKPNYKGKWPKCSYFGIFDGHGGSACSDFLKDNMHKYITQNQHFPHKPIEALKQGFKNAEAQFLRLAQCKNPVERSGSCAIVLLVIDQICYIANVGDSRAILSTKSGKNAYAISRDHKPDSQMQRSRIMQAGGNIYQSSIKKNGNIIYGPFRIQPGKLSVSRSFGDIQAKKPQYGGNPKVLIAKPQITYFTIDPSQHDFIMMGSDGIFDKLENQQIVQQFWSLRGQAKKSNRIQDKTDNLSFVGKAASRVITKAMENVSLDNLTTLFVIFDNQDKLLNQLSNKGQIAHHAIQQNIRQSQRVKSTAQQKNSISEDESSYPQKISLKQQASRIKLINQNQNPFYSNLIKQEQRNKIIPTNQINRKKQPNKNYYHQKGQQQNVQSYANRQPILSQHFKEQKYVKSGDGGHLNNNKSVENKNVGKSVVQPYSELGPGVLIRKKSQGILRKDSKKESVWNSINRGPKNSEKVIEKIRY